MKKPLRQTWDLEDIFAGGSESPELEEFLTDVDADIRAFEELMQTQPGTVDVAHWVNLTDTLQEIGGRLRQAGSYLNCLIAQDVDDRPAQVLSARLKQLSAEFSSVLTLLDQEILQLSDGQWEDLLQADQLKPLAFPLNEQRERAADKLSPNEESLASGLSVDGYHAWGDLYNQVIGSIMVPFKHEGKEKELSVGQVSNLLSSGNRQVRAGAFDKLETALADQGELCASALNHLAGFRLNLYAKRGWKRILKEPLEYNRMTQATLDAMWSAVTEAKPRLVEYLNRKASLLQLERLAWYDVGAPLSAVEQKVSYDQAAEFIVEQFRRFNPAMAEFATRAFESSWIEAEDRPGKRPGGFCTSFPLSKQSRIFMTYGGSASNVSTLAHELGHAYHQSVMNPLPRMTQRYAMNVAETASTFAEMIVSDAAIKNADSQHDKLSLLADKVQRSVAFFMNIHARFLFETRFYDQRQHGMLSVEQLNELMVTAQKEAYCDALSSYHPYFWASKLHFYITGVPFYNFPYTFGYLFSSGVYARALAEGTAFARKYELLLQDTGRMTVEDLAAKHLDVDLTRPDFWQAAVGQSVADIDEFLKLTE